MGDSGEILFADYKVVKNFKCDRKSLELLLYLKDGKPLSLVSANLDMTIADAELTVKKFISSGLLLTGGQRKTPSFAYPEEGNISSVKRVVQVEKKAVDFLENIREKFSKAIGPIADVILEDCIVDMGETFDSFPVSRLAELVNFLSREIPRDDKKNKFQREMMNDLKKYH